MKKMNFYFNFGRCCTFLLPILMFFAGTSLQAADLNNNLLETLGIKKTSAVAVNATLTAVNATCAGGTGSLTVNVTATAAALPYSIKITIFNAANAVIGVNNAVGVAGPVPISYTLPNVAIGNGYKARVTIENPAGTVLEFVDLAAVNIAVVRDATPPTLTCPTSTTINLPNCATTGVITWTAPTATDACGNTLPVVQTGGPANGSTQPAGTYVITYSTTDPNAAAPGNTPVVCNFNVTLSASCGNIASFGVRFATDASCEAADGYAEVNARFEGAGAYDVVLYDNLGFAVNNVALASGTSTAAGFNMGFIPVSNLLAGNYYARIRFTPTGGLQQRIDLPFTIGKKCGLVSDFGVRNVVNATCGTANGKADYSFTISGAGTFSAVLRGPGTADTTIFPATTVTAAGTFKIGTLNGLAAGNYSLEIIYEEANPGTTIVYPQFINIPFTVGSDFNAANMACIGGSATSPGLNISLAANCSTPIKASQVLSSGCGTINDADFTVVVKTLGGTDVADATATIAHVGKVLSVEVTHKATGNKCWGYVKIEDKTKPVIVAPNNVVLACDKADDAYNLAKVGELASTGGLNQNDVSDANATATGAADGTVQECSAFNQFYSDVVTGDACLTDKVITRTWWAKDVWGNTSDTKTQTIRIKKRDANVLATTRDIQVPCSVTDVTPEGLNTAIGAAFAGYPFFIYPPATDSIKAANACNVTATYTDRPIATCVGGYKIIRTWEITDMCRAANAMIYTLTQTIEVRDLIAPSVKVSYTDYTREKDGTYCVVMNGAPMTPNPDMWKTVAKVVKTVFNNDAGVIDIRPLANSTMCGAGSISLDLEGEDKDCSNGTVTFTTSDSRLDVVSLGSNKWKISNKTGFPFMKDAAGNNPMFVISATDPCQNVKKDTFRVILEDNMTPNTVCKVFTTATLDQNGSVRIPTSAFENGSSDNCGIERQHVRRMTKSNNDACNTQGQIAETACWNDYVDFTCADLGDKDADGGQLMVALRSVDGAGNHSDCMVRVDIVDKTKPTCSNPDPIVIDCEDARIANYTALFASINDMKNNSYDNCGVSVAVKSTSALDLACGAGTAKRIWEVTDCGNNKTECEQTITVNAVRGYTFKRLKNLERTCEAYNRATELTKAREEILASVTKKCGTKVLVEAEDWEFFGNDYCKKYLQKFTILDCCPANALGFSTVELNSQAGNSAETTYTIDGTTCSGAATSSDRCINRKYVYYRVIVINDKTAPVAGNLPAIDTCIYDACNYKFSVTVPATDNCDATVLTTPTIYYSFVLRNGLNNIVPGSTINQASNNTGSYTYTMTGLSFNETYTLCYTVADACGNVSQPKCVTIKGKDCKKPAIVCKNVNAELMPLGPTGGATPPGGAIIVPISDLYSWASDNCTPADQLKFSLATTDGGTITAVRWVAGLLTEVAVGSGEAAIKYTCSDATANNNQRKVQLWVEDLSGNKDYCEATVTLQNHMGACTGAWSVSGGARTEANAIVNNITVSASANGTTVSSANVLNGSYNLTVPASATNVQVRAAKNNNDDAASGVTTFDIAKVSQHVLDIEKLATPYKLIAADVDKSGEVDATDMLHMRRFILKITPALPGGNFRFVDKAYSFRNAANPFGEDFPEVVSIATLTSNASANFVAVKLGDVNDSYAALAPRSSRTLSFLANDMNVVAGNEYTVNISADKMDAAAFQGTFSFNGATVKSVKAGDLANMTDGNFGVFANAVTTSWNGKTQASAEVLAITFVATKSGKLSEMLTINSELTQAVANDATGAEMNVNLKFNTGKVAGGEFALYQNQPNPVANETTIGFNLPKDGTARLTVTAVDGKVVKVINGDYKAGYNTISVNKSDLNATGVFYYRLETADHSASKKMVIIE